MSELPEGLSAAEPAVARPSASTILLRGSAAAGWELLLGLRSRGARFMPGHLAFPGGGLEPEDEPAAPGHFRRCASRELLEETGLDLPAEDWRAAGERTTPALFPVRFHTKFFVAELPRDAALPSPTSGENESLRLARPRDLVAEWTAGRAKLPPPVLAIVRALSGEGEWTIEEVVRRVESANAEEERAPRIEFAPDVWMLPLRTATLPPATHTNAWMPGGRRFVVIDPAVESPAELGRLLAVVERRRALGHEPVALLLTHHHRDHATGAAYVASALSLPLRAHAATLDALRPALDAVETSSVGDGETIDLDGMTLRALHTPGHAAGHLAFLVEGRRLLIAGDLVSGLSTILIDPDDGDMDEYLASLARAAACDCSLLFPGHGPPLPGRRLSALIEHRQERERRIVEAMASGGLLLSAIAIEAYADTPGLPPALIEGQTLAHLRRLGRQGRARCADGCWTAR